MGRWCSWTPTGRQKCRGIVIIGVPVPLSLSLSLLLFQASVVSAAKGGDTEREKKKDKKEKKLVVSPSPFPRLFFLLLSSTFLPRFPVSAKVDSTSLTILRVN